MARVGCARHVIIKKYDMGRKVLRAAIYIAKNNLVTGGLLREKSCSSTLPQAGEGDRLGGLNKTMATAPWVSGPSWPHPLDITSITGLGGGLTWAEETGLCAALLDKFEAETFHYFGTPIYSFVSCEEITDALLRGFSTWSANHGRLQFFEMSHECTQDGGSAESCALAEVIINGSALEKQSSGWSTPLTVTIDDGSVDPSSGSFSSDSSSGESATGNASTIRRVTINLDTENTCYYMDGTVCEMIRLLGASTRVPQLLGEYDVASLVGLDSHLLALVIARAILYATSSCHPASSCHPVSSCHPATSCHPASCCLASSLGPPPLLTPPRLLPPRSYTPALFGLLYLVHNLLLLTMRSHRAGVAHCLYVVASLSHRWRLLCLLLCLPPLVDWKMLLPCQQCVAFEALATHAAGRALGLAALDANAANTWNVASGATAANASASYSGTSSSGRRLQSTDPSSGSDVSSGDPWPPPPSAPAAPSPPPVATPSQPPPRGTGVPTLTLPRECRAVWLTSLPNVSHSGVTVVHSALDPPGPLQGSTCLSAVDMHLLASRYPDCLAVSVADVPICPDARRHIWAFRLALVSLPPISIFFAALMPAILLIRWMSKHRVRSLGTPPPPHTLEAAATPPTHT